MQKKNLQGYCQEMENSVQKEVDEIIKAAEEEGKKLKKLCTQKYRQGYKYCYGRRIVKVMSIVKNA